MAELNDVLRSGFVPEVNVSDSMTIAGSEVLTPDSFVGGGVFSTGLPIPISTSADAANGTIFFDPDEGQIRYKSPAGILLRFRMQLV